MPIVSGSHSTHQCQMLELVWLNNAIAPHTVMTAAMPIRRGPNRSTNMPMNGAQMAATVAAIE